MASINNIFWVNPCRKLVKTRNDFLKGINGLSRVEKYIQHENPYRVIVKLVSALLGDVDATLVDPSMPETVVSEERAMEETSVEADVEIEGWGHLVQAVRDAAGSGWKLGLFTSGSTGAPKHVWQSVETLTRSVKTAPRFKDHRWGLCYEPTHMAGIQVLFQAISNGNALCYLFESDPETIGSMIDKYEITHLSATPTFYRVRLLQLADQYPSVRRLTSGGEPFDSRTMERLRTIFPEAQVRNIYALTETGPLFESDTERFEIPEAISDSVRVGQDSELLLDESLVSDDAETAVDDAGWFHTGDIVQQHDNGEIEFLGRDSDEVTVAGYQVHPREIEQEVLAADEHVIEVAVRARDSSVTGKVLVADLVLSECAEAKRVIQNVRSTLNERMSKYKVPRKFYVVDEIDRTRSGKKKRT